MTEEKTFGYKHLYFVFKPEFSIKADMLLHKGRVVKWGDITKIRIHEGLIKSFQHRIDSPAYWLRGKRTVITLKSGEEIHIRSDLTQKKTKIKFRVSQLSDEYKWLRDWVISHVPEEIVEGERH